MAALRGEGQRLLRENGWRRLVESQFGNGRLVGQFQRRNKYVEYTVEQVPHMQIVQIVLDKKLLHAADQAAKRTKRNRSALVRDALREHLRRLELLASEERDRQGYSQRLQTDAQADAEARGWESEATWPQE